MLEISADLYIEVYRIKPHVPPTTATWQTFSDSICYRYTIGEYCVITLLHYILVEV